MRQFLRNMRPVAQTPYHYLECGLDDVYLLNGFSIEEHEEFGELLTIEDADDLHSLLAWEVMTQSSRFNGQELRFVRREMGLTQKRLANALDVNVQTVARWEKDQSVISGPANRLLKFLAVGSYLTSHVTVEEARGIFEEVQQALARFDGDLSVAEAMLGKPSDDRSLDGWKLQIAA